MTTSHMAHPARTALRCERVGGAVLRYGLALILIWIGALVMFLGGAISLSDRRLRVGAPKRGEPRAAPAAAGE